MTAATDRSAVAGVRPEDPRRSCLWAAAIAAVAVATGVLGYFAMFSIFNGHDDEGYLLLSLRQYIAGDTLYRQVYTQYGPFYYAVVGGILRTLGHAATTNDGRLFTLALWLVASILMGVTAANVTRSIPLAAAAQMLSFFVLTPLISEPIHPQALVALLVAGMVAVAAAVPLHRIRFRLAALGALGAAILLTKMNIGVFAFTALGFACVAAFSSPWPRLLRPLLYIAVIAAPFVLMLHDLSADGNLRYATVVSLGALTVVAVASTVEPAAGTRTAWIFPTTAGAGILVAVVAVVMALHGVGVQDVIEAALITAAHQRSFFTFPLLLPLPLIAWAVLSSAVAAGWVLYHGRDGVPSFAATVGKFAVGITLWLLLLGDPLFLDPGGGIGLGVAVGLAWYAAVPISGSIDPVSAFKRLFLATLAVLCSLQAYPVAGTQVGMALFVFVPLGALAFADGWRAHEARRTLPAVPMAARMRAVVAGAVLLEVAIVAWLLPLREYARRYRTGVPLRIAAADQLHLPADQAQTLEWLVRTLTQHCATFVSYPGLDSLYVMTGMRPPSGINPNDWMFMLDDVEQQAVVDAAQASPRLCAVRNRSYIRFWGQGRPVPDGPLVQFIERAFQPFESKDGYDVLLRK